MKEIRRRIMSTAEDGVACGPVSMYAIDAEIVVEDEGNEVYLHGQWISEVSYLIHFTATTESMYDLYEGMTKALNEDDRETFEQLCKERDRRGEETDVCKIFGEVDLKARYAEQYQEMLQMMQEMLNKDGMDVDLAEEIEE